MPENKRHIFIAHTDDVCVEVKLVKEVVNDINESYDVALDCYSFKDASPHHARQGVQNTFDKKLTKSHICIGIFGKTLGSLSNSNNNETNIQKEINLVEELNNNEPDEDKKKDVYLFFKIIATKEFRENEEYQKVLKLKKEKKEKFYFFDFKNEDGLKLQLHKVLGLYAHRLKIKPNQQLDRSINPPSSELSNKSVYAKALKDLEKYKDLNEFYEIVARKMHLLSASFFHAFSKDSTLDPNEIHRIYIYREKISPSIPLENELIIRSIILDNFSSSGFNRSSLKCGWFWFKEYNCLGSTILKSIKEFSEEKYTRSILLLKYINLGEQDIEYLKSKLESLIQSQINDKAKELIPLLLEVLYMKEKDFATNKAEGLINHVNSKIKKSAFKIVFQEELYSKPSSALSLLINYPKELGEEKRNIKSIIEKSTDKKELKNSIKY